jgi:hypothetical protein
MAMVSEPRLLQLMLTMLFPCQPPPIPLKSFTDDQDARAWLQR